MSYDCWCSVAPPHGAVGWSALCDSCIFLSYSLTFFQWRRLLSIVRGCGSVSIDSIFIVAPVYGGVLCWSLYYLFNTYSIIQPSPVYVSFATLKIDYLNAFTHFYLIREQFKRDTKPHHLTNHRNKP